MKFNLVIFDFDGTVVDSQEGIIKCVHYALESIGIHESDYSKLLSFIGPPLFETFRDLYSLDDETAKQMVYKYRERYRPEGYRECHIYDGITELLSELRACGVKTAVASAKPQEFVLKICKELGIDCLFDAIVGAELKDVDSDKSRLVERAFLEAGGDSKASTAMVGDSKFDVLAAKSTGMYGVGVEYGFGSVEEFTAAGADEIVKDVAALREILLGRV